VDDLVDLAHSPDPNRRRELLELFGLLASQYDYRPMDAAALPYGELAVQFARNAGGRAIVHNFGAVACLERLIGLVREGGFILVNDYGSTDAAGADDFQHQRFSRSTFVGVNFALLKSYFSRSAPVRWIEPEDEGRNIYARLLGIAVAAETTARFQVLFSKAAWDWLEEPVQQARKCVKEGRLEAAVSAFQRAVERQPHNWSLMHEIAHFLTFALRSPAAGLEMTKAALAENPACSADLYNILGDSLYMLRRFEEAEQAFRRALEVNADDVRARLNLAFVYLQTKQYAAALERIAQGLMLDRGTYREELLQKQSEVLIQLAQRNEQERSRMANRISNWLAADAPGSNVP
jgi:tetratricopeptide (TPR) repeat protein